MSIRERQKNRVHQQVNMRRAAKRMEEKEPQTLVFGDKEAISICPLGGSALNICNTHREKDRTSVLIKKAMNEHYLTEEFN